MGLGLGLASAWLHEFLNVAVVEILRCISFCCEFIFTREPTAGCLQRCRISYIRCRNTASTGSRATNNINLNLLANYISFLGQPSIKECAFNELTELIYRG